MPDLPSIKELTTDFLAENWFYIAIAVIFGALSLWGKLFGGRSKKKAAKQIAETTNTAYHTGFRAQPIDLQSIKYLDHGFYQSVTEELAASGFQPLGDIELLHVTEATPKLRTGLRVFGVAHGTIIGAAFHVKIRGLTGLIARIFNGRNNIHVVEFQTGLTDGRWIITNNSGDANGMSDHVKIQNNKLDPDVTPTEVLKQHIEFVRAQITPGGPTPIVANTLEQILELEAQQHALQSSHREDVGPVTEQELATIAPEVSAKDRADVAQEAGKLTFGPPAS